MGKSTALFFILVIVSGCGRWRQDVVERVRDTTIYVQLQADTLIKYDSVYIIDSICFSDSSILENSVSVSVVQVVAGKLRHELRAKDTVIEKQIEIVEKTITIEKEPTKWQKIQINAWKVLLPVLLIIVFFIKV